MPKVKVEASSSASPKDAFAKIKTMLQDDKDLRKMDAGYQCEFNEASLTGSAKGSQFDAKMTVVPQAQGAKVEIEVELPFILTPVKGVVQSTLQKKLDKALS